MTETQLQRMAQAAAVIRRVVGSDFRCHVPIHWRHLSEDDQCRIASGSPGVVLILQHDAGEPLYPYVNYDGLQYDKIEQLSSALGEIGLMVEDKTGWWSGVYEEVT